MSAGFGFSVGDFIAALKIVSDVIDALRESGNSTAESRLLLRQLYDLETALIHVKRLELDEAQADELYALRRAALQCCTTIDEFMKKIQKYQPHLHSSHQSTSSAIKKSWYKIKWALCQREDIEKFKADLVGHTEAINILMSAISIQQMTLQSRARETRHSSLKSIIVDYYTNTIQKLSVISDVVASSLLQSKKLLEITAQTAQMDCRIFGAILDIQDLLRKSVAPQVLRAQPVYFVDALGIPSPFYLEFIRSKDAFLAVLRSNMKSSDMAVRRIDYGEFAISDMATKRDIDLSHPWDMCFRPGQKVDMSMVMEVPRTSISSCPSCKTECPVDQDLDIVCANCGLTFRRLTELDKPEPPTAGTPAIPGAPLVDGKLGRVLLGPTAPNRKRKRETDLAQELMIYRRVRLWQPLVAEQRFMADLSVIVDDLSTNQSVSDLEDKSRPDVEFKDAINFVDRVKLRYSQNPSVYRKFLDILKTHQRASGSVTEVYILVVRLFSDSPDLIKDFNFFMPQTAAAISLDDLAESNDRDLEQPRPVLKDALKFLDKVKIRFSKSPEVYKNFLDVMKSFKEKRTSTNETVLHVKKLLREAPSLVEDFRVFLPEGFTRTD